MLKKLKRGDSYHFQHNDICLVVWKDQNILKLLYNHIQPDTIASTLKRWGDNGTKFDLSCPQAIKDYFYHARSVDVINQLHYSYPIGRKSKNSTSPMIYWLVDICIVNSFTLYKAHHAKITQLQYRQQLMHELVELHCPSTSSSSCSTPNNNALKLASEHYPICANKEGDCQQCSNRRVKRTRSSFLCAACNVHLCVGECFGLYHR
jgi:hypothetical protein